MESFELARIRSDHHGHVPGGSGRRRTALRRAIASCLALGAISAFSVDFASAEEVEANTEVAVENSTPNAESTAVESPVAESTATESNLDLAARDDRHDDRGPPHHRRHGYRGEFSRRSGHESGGFGDRRHGPPHRDEARFDGRDAHRWGPHDRHDGWHHARFEGGAPWHHRASHYGPSHHQTSHHTDGRASEELLRRLIDEISRLRQEVHQLRAERGPAGPGPRGPDRNGAPGEERRGLRQPPAGPSEGARGERREGSGRRGPPPDRSRDGGPPRHRPGAGGPPQTGSIDSAAPLDQPRAEPRETAENSTTSEATRAPAQSDTN